MTNTTFVGSFHSNEAEEAVLGSCLIHPESLPAVVTSLKSSDFYVVQNAWIYEAICAIYKRGETVDDLSLVRELCDYNQLETIGGSTYIMRLINNTPTHIHAETYARIVERAAIRRQLLGSNKI